MCRPALPHARLLPARQPRRHPSQLRFVWLLPRQTAPLFGPQQHPAPPRSRRRLLPNPPAHAPRVPPPRNPTGPVLSRLGRVVLSVRDRATSRHPFRLPRRVVACRPSPTPISPTGPVCSTSMNVFAAGRWAIRARLISTSAVRRSIRVTHIVSNIADVLFRRSCRAEPAARRHRRHLADHACARQTTA